MERPKGVTVMACVFLFMAFALVNGLVTYPVELVQKRGLLAIWMVNISLAVTLGIALLRMKNWSRWLGIVACAVSLVFVPHEVTVAHGSIAIIRGGLRALFFVWAIWYLFLPDVKAAFRSA